MASALRSAATAFLRQAAPLSGEVPLLFPLIRGSASHFLVESVPIAINSLDLTPSPACTLGQICIAAWTTSTPPFLACPAELKALSTLGGCWTGTVESGNMNYALGLSVGIAGAFLLSEAISDEPKDSEVEAGSVVSSESNGSGPKKSLFDRIKEKYNSWKQLVNRDLDKERSDLKNERALFEKEKSQFEKQRVAVKKEWRELQIEKAHMWKWGKDYYEKKLEHEKFMDEDNKFHERVMADKKFEQLQLQYKIAKIPKVPSDAATDEGPYRKAWRGSLIALNFPGSVVTSLQSFEKSCAFWVATIGTISFSYFTVDYVKAFVDGRYDAIQRHVNRILGQTPGPNLCYCGKPYPELCSFCGEMLPEFEFVIIGEDLYGTYPSIVVNAESTASLSKASSGGKA